MCFFPSTMNNSLLAAPCITSHMAFGQALEDAALDASGCELMHNVQKHPVWAMPSYPPDHLPPPAILLQAAPDLMPFVWWPFDMRPLPASHTEAAGDFFLSSGPFLPLHGRRCPFAAAVLDTSTMSKSWETTSRGNALKMRSPTSVQRNRLF